MQDTESRELSVDRWRSYREGALSNVLNPKTVIFYMAFLPQFISPEGSAFWQSQPLAGLHFVICMCWQCFLAIMVARARHLLASPRFSKAFHSMTGSVIVMLGVKLALARQ
ncbi:LysE family translocator [Sansalvadorimonas sp. 2012CJ34-2]|uniref:LysE family translocator n=1 Tax=Parendozoicomonas callyspongiae TaxID=2942213 RepID=A0ABT0PLT2_9GAMM|nr:LysE family translocator [Sansalvadorimonas sp. 2012CJ34-2]